MDFYTHQAQATQRTKLLVVLFVLSAISLIVLLNLIFACTLILMRYGDLETDIWNSFDAKQWISITVIASSGILGASLSRWHDLRAGGKAVAQSLGGQLISPDSTEFYARRALNVVEEMALAAGMPVPPVYLLEESEINAFAAGYNPSDAVIGLTRGTLEKLSREQLQGVVAHEFSHILNGDMRLNIRMMAMLHGILFIHLAGKKLLDIALDGLPARSRDRDNPAGALVVLGLVLVVVGWLGFMFAKLIKAAVSRQREFLADASAVQFTRNPGGIGGALKVIAVEGSRVRNPSSEEASHLFFGQVQRRSVMSFLNGLWATHPAIDERIRRIEPRWHGEYLRPQTRYEAEREEPRALAFGPKRAAMATVVTASVLSATKPTPVQERLNTIANDPGLAPILLYALLLSEDEAVRQIQLKRLSENNWLYNEDRLLAMRQKVLQLSAHQRLPMVERAIGALKQMDQSSYQDWLERVSALIQADKRVDLFEWCLYRLVRQYLDAHFKPQSAWTKQLKEDEVQQDLAVLLSTVAHYGHADKTEAELAFNAGAKVAGFQGLSFTDKAEFKALNRTLTRLKSTAIPWRGRVIKALNAVVYYDQQVSAEEQDLLITIAAVLEVPLAEINLFIPNGQAAE